MKNPRIAIIGLKGLPAFGGAATVGEQIVHHLRDRYEFTVYAVSSHTSAQTGNMGGFRQFVFRKSRIKALNTFFYFFRALLHVMFVEKYDLIHLHHYSSGFITPFLRLRYNVVVTFHGVYRKGNPDVKFGRVTNSFLRMTQWLNTTFASRLISVSGSDAGYLRREYRVNVITIPNGVGIPAGISRESMNEQYIVFAAGRIYDIKGLHVLLEAMHINKEKSRLLVIGDLEQVGSYQKKILLLTEGLNVTFIPLIKEKDKLFQIIAGAGFFVFPSLTEAMSMMLLEVAALKIPIVASDIDANTGVFSHSELLFFESGSSHNLAEKLKYAQSHPGIMMEKAENAYEKVKKEYNWLQIGDSYSQIYSEVIVT